MAYKNNKEMLQWKCNKSHSFEKSLRDVLSGFWCPVCKKVEKFRQLQDYAIERAGKLITKEYLSSTAKHTWMCGKGHSWAATPNSTLNKGTWCRFCRRTREGKLTNKK